MKVHRIKQNATFRQDCSYPGCCPDNDCVLADDIHKTCVTVGDCASDADCASGEVCQDCTCVSDGGGGGGTDCSGCYVLDPILGECVWGCGPDEECVNGTCEPTNGGGGGGGSQFDPSLVSVSACSVDSTVQREGQYTITVEVSNGNDVQADVSLNVSVGQSVVVQDNVFVAGGGVTETFTYQRAAFLEEGNYAVNAGVRDITAAPALSTRAPRGVKARSRFSQTPDCPEGEIWDPINKRCIPIVDDPSCDCTENEVCIDGECVPAGEDCGGCPTGQICDPVLGECVADTSCSSDADCGAASQCVSGVCIAKGDDGGGTAGLSNEVLAALGIAAVAAGGYAVTQT